MTLFARTITPELMQRNLRRLVSKSVMSVTAIGTVAGIDPEKITRLLNSDDCQFTVREVADLTTALGYKFEAVLEAAPEMRPCMTAECVETEHEWVNDEQFSNCRLEAFERDGFIIHGHLLDDGWTAWVDADDLEDAHEGVVQAHALAAAFEQMQHRCDQLNAATTGKDEA